MALTQTVPALPVRSLAPAIAHWTARLGFALAHRGDGLAVLVRDDAEVHLWEATDDTWRDRGGAGGADGGRDDRAPASPVVTGAETFLAGTASCRIRCSSAGEVDALHAELLASDTLHPTDPGSPVDTAFGAREVNALDADGNLVTFFFWG